MQRKTMERQEEVDFNRAIVRSIVENDTEWKKIRELLRKEGVTTTYAVQQYILKEAVDQRVHKKRDSSHDRTKRYQQSCDHNQQHQDDDTRDDDKEVCRRLSVSSVDRVVKKLLRFHDRDSSMRSMRRLLSYSAPNLRSSTSSTKSSTTSSSSASSSSASSSSSSLTPKKNSVTSKSISLADIVKCNNGDRLNTNSVWDTWTGVVKSAGTPIPNKQVTRTSSNLYAQLDSLAVNCPTDKKKASKAEKLKGSLEAALNLVSLEDEIWNL